MSEEVLKKIGEMVENNKVILFMKGTKEFPQCGFSARSVAILNEIGAEFEAVNVLEDNNIREGIKLYGQWPTIPQLYINKELIGGSDIMMEMYENGELKEMISKL